MRFSEKIADIFQNEPYYPDIAEIAATVYDEDINSADNRARPFERIMFETFANKVTENILLKMIIKIAPNVSLPNFGSRFEPDAWISLLEDGCVTDDDGTLEVYARTPDGYCEVITHLWYIITKYKDYWFDMALQNPVEFKCLCEENNLLFVWFNK